MLIKAVKAGLTLSVKVFYQLGDEMKGFLFYTFSTKNVVNLIWASNKSQNIKSRVLAK